MAVIFRPVILSTRAISGPFGPGTSWYEWIGILGQLFENFETTCNIAVERELEPS